MDNSGETYVSGVWQGVDAAYRGPALAIPSQFSEAIRRKADHFETLLGVLKILAHVENLSAPDLPYWLPKARAAIAKALASAPDPLGEPDSFANRTHVLVQLEEIRVRDAIAPIIESDSELTQLPPTPSPTTMSMRLASPWRSRPTCRRNVAPPSFAPRSQRSVRRNAERLRPPDSRLPHNPDEARPLRRASSFQEHRNGRRFHPFLMAA
jgi:hypothetical protein